MHYQKIRNATCLSHDRKIRNVTCLSHDRKIRNVACLSHDRKQKEINTNVNIYDITVHYITFHVKKNH